MTTNIPNTISSILERVSAQPNGCWHWLGYKNARGYGYVSFAGKNHRVHRLVYQTLVGPIPDGLELDHKCRVRHCCNPDHLEPVTHQENVIRAKRRPYCRAGHLLSEENIRRTNDGIRRCRICRNLREAARRAVRA